MNKKEVEAKIERYALECINKENKSKTEENCENLWKSIQEQMLPKSRCIKKK